MTRLALQPGDTIQTDGSGGNLLLILRRLRRGWLVRPQGHDASGEIDDLDLVIAYRERRLRHWPCDLEGLDERTSGKLKGSFDAYPPAQQRECLRKLVFVQALDRVRDEHRDVLQAAKAVTTEVWREHGPDWLQEERDAAVKERLGIRRRDGDEQDADDVTPRRVEEPRPSTVRTWYSAWVQAGRCELALIPDWSRRGHRAPRYPVAKGEDERDTYQMMDEAARDGFNTLNKNSKQVAFELYEKLCFKWNLPKVSSRTFRRFIARKYSEYEQCAKREGKKAAFLRFGVFSMRDLPDRPLEEVEVDHCLVDLIVVDEDGKPIGRPWITVLLDRASKCIVGVHVSFMPPSYLTIQRALGHAMYEKDMSAFPGLKNAWRCFGLPEWLISDRGKEFLSRSFRTACLLLHIYAIALPGRKPWLKGAVERIFRTMHARVFDLREGSTKAWDADTYNSAKRATINRAEFDRMFVEWIVDDYHQAPHPALKRKYGREMTPDQAWVLLDDRYGVRFAPDPQLAFRLTGEIFTRKILSTGIHIKTHVYLDKPLLERLLRMPDGRTRDWVFRRDRADLGRIWVLVEDEGWHEIPNVDLDLFDGASEQQYALWVAEATSRLAVGEVPVIADLREARRRVEQAREKALNGRGSKLMKALRYAQFGEMSRTFTPVPGFGPQPRAPAPETPLGLPAPGATDPGGADPGRDAQTPPDAGFASDPADADQDGDHDGDEDLGAASMPASATAGALDGEIDAEVRRMLEEMDA